MSAGAAFAPHTETSRCGVCGGHPGLPAGQGKRCAGATGDTVIWCTRPEYAGGLPLDGRLSPAAYQHRRYGPCDCRAEHGAPRATITAMPTPKPSRAEAVPLGVRDVVYAAILTLLPLRPEARDDLLRRGLTDDEIAAHGFRSLPRKGHELEALITALVRQFGEAALRRVPGLTDKNDRLTFWSAAGSRDGYVVPYRDEQGRITGLQAKLLGGKYLTARGTNLAVVYNVVGAAPGRHDLYLTEGATKGVVAADYGNRWTFAVAGQSLAPAHVAVIQRLAPRRVIIALDEEANPHTDAARQRWAAALHAAGLAVSRTVWEGADLGGPKGLDDLLVAGGTPRIRAVTFAPAGLGERRSPIATDTPGPVDAGASLAEVRAQTQRAIHDVIVHARKHQGTALLVRTSPGSGKTTAVMDAAQESHANVRMVMGNRALAQEVAQTHGFALYQGRNRETCHESRLPVVDALGKKGFPIADLACGSWAQPRCPFRRTCAYWQQADTPGSRVGTTEQLYNPRFLEGGTVAVVDDADLARAMIERTHFDDATLEHAITVLRPLRRDPLVRLLTLLRHAIVDAPRHDGTTAGPALLGAAVWDHLARTAARQGEDLAGLIAVLPQHGTVPEPAGDEHGVIRVEDVAVAPPASLLRLVDVLRDELPSFQRGEGFNSALRLHPGGIDLWRVRPHATRTRVHEGQSPVVIADMALLVLDATPIPALVDRLTQHHERLPDVAGTIALPPNVRVVQHAEAGNGHTALKQAERRAALLRQVAAERERFPVDGPEQEAAVGFKAHREALAEMGFAPDRVLTFGSARGTNVLAGVTRLHLAGRPMPPGDELVYLAAVIHHGEAPIDPTLTLSRRAYGNQPHAITVLDFADDRVAALLKGARDDEVVQVIHRARLLTLDPQLRMDGPAGAGLGTEALARTRVTLIIHSSHPVPGLRVDELHLPGAARDVNSERAAAAEQRIREAEAILRGRGESVTMNALARLTGANKQTIAKALGTAVHTPNRDSLKGVNRCPQSEPAPTSVTPSPAPPNSRSSGFCQRCGRLQWLDRAGYCRTACAMPAVVHSARVGEERRR